MYVWTVQNVTAQLPFLPSAPRRDGRLDESTTRTMRGTLTPPLALSGTSLLDLGLLRTSTMWRTSPNILICGDADFAYATALAKRLQEQPVKIFRISIRTGSRAAFTLSTLPMLWNHSHVRVSPCGAALMHANCVRTTSNALMHRLQSASVSSSA